MRLIDADSLRQVLKNHARRYGKKQDSEFTQGCHCGVSLAIFELENTESEETGSGLHGFWVDETGEGDSAVCSRCGECFDTTEAEVEWRKAFELFRGLYKYCPHCGARMDGDGE